MLPATVLAPMTIRLPRLVVKKLDFDLNFWLDRVYDSEHTLIPSLERQPPSV